MKFTMKMPRDTADSPEFTGAADIVRTLKQHSFEAYIVGGAVRDAVLGCKPKDYDVTTNALPQEIAGLFPHSIPLGAAFGVMTVVHPNGVPYEVATFREEREYSDGRHPETVLYTSDVKLDVIRRDFTFNALLYDPVESCVIDYTGGIDDLKKGVLRAIGDPVQRFSEDYLRILRAVRFSARLGCVPDPATAAAAKALAPRLTAVSSERIRSEVEHMLLDRHAANALRMMAELDILKTVLPEIDVMRGMEQPQKFHPEGDVFEHTLLMLSRAPVRTPALVWSLLLHDVGKPLTQTFDDGVPHFYGHEKIGAELAEVMLKRLKHSNSLIESVVAAVRNHMRFAHVNVMKKAKLKRIVADANFPLELELHRLDCLCSNGLLGNYVFMLERYAELSSKGEQSLPKPFVNGRDLIEAGLAPSPKFKFFLDRIYELQLEGALASREDALKELHSML